MVTRAAWLPGNGTYNVETTNDVYNPTSGQVYLTSKQPKDMNHDEEKRHSSEPINPDEEVQAKSALQWYLNIASLANLATLEKADKESNHAGEWYARGAPTEIAIEVFASRFGWNRIKLSQDRDAQWAHIAEFPFDSDVKKMSVLFKNKKADETHVFTKVRKTTLSTIYCLPASD